MEVAKCVQKLLWHVPNANSVTTILPRIRRLILTEWKSESIADFAGSTQRTRKPNKLTRGGKGKARRSALWEKGMVRMGDSAEKKAAPGFFKGVKAEFKKIIWPDRRATLKQSVAVVVISVVVGVMIALLDYVAKNGVDFIIGLRL